MICDEGIKLVTTILKIYRIGRLCSFVAKLFKIITKTCGQLLTEEWIKRDEKEKRQGNKRKVRNILDQTLENQSLCKICQQLSFTIYLYINKIKIIFEGFQFDFYE